MCLHCPEKRDQDEDCHRKECDSYSKVFDSVNNRSDCIAGINFIYAVD